MFKFVLALAVALTALPALAAEPASTQERVVNLPRDEAKPYLTIAGAKNDARYTQIASWFKTNRDLAAIKNACHYHAYTTDDVMFKARYAKHMPVTPIVRLQSPEGYTLWEAFGNDIPTSTSTLANALNTKTRCPWRNRHEPEEEAAPQEEEQPLEVAPAPEPEGVHIVTLLVVVGVSLAAGGAIGLAQYLKRYTKKAAKLKK